MGIVVVSPGGGCTTSSSASVAVIVRVLKPAAETANVAWPFVVSTSWAAETVTFCAMFQLAGVNTRDDGAFVRSVSPDWRPIVTVTSLVGWALRRTVNDPVAPSLAMRLVLLSTSPCRGWTVPSCVTTSCGRFAVVPFSSLAKVAQGSVMFGAFRAKVTDVAPAALSCARYAVTSHSCHAPDVPLIVFVASAAPAAGLLFHVRVVSLIATLPAPCTATDTLPDADSFPFNRTFAAVTLPVIDDRSNETQLSRVLPELAEHLASSSVAPPKFWLAYVPSRT